jgi:hypothetical protein
MLALSIKIFNTLTLSRMIFNMITLSIKIFNMLALSLKIFSILALSIMIFNIIKLSLCWHFKVGCADRVENKLTCYFYLSKAPATNASGPWGLTFKCSTRKVSLTGPGLVSYCDRALI